MYAVSVVMPKFVDVPQSYTLEGIFDASETNTITSTGEGLIEQLYVNEGDGIAKGEPVILISNSILLEKIDINRSLIKKYQARLREVQARLASLGNVDQPVNNEDTTFLDEDSQEPSITKKFGDSNAVQAKPTTLKALVELLQAAIERLGKESDAMDRELLSLSLNSPENGIVTKVYVSAGNRVKEQDKLVDVSVTDPLSVKFYVPSEVANFIDKNSTVSVSPVDAKNISATGTVYYISPSIDSNSNLLEMRAHVSNENNLIKGGQKAVVNVMTRKMSQVIVLPKKAIHYENDKKYIFITFQDQAKMTQIEVVGETSDGQVQVRGDLRVDDPIIIDRPQELKNNSFVRIKNSVENSKELTN